MTEKTDLLIFVTVMAGLRSVMALLPHLCSSIRFESLPTHNKWHVWDRNLSLFYYIGVETAFVALVLWGFEFLSDDVLSRPSDGVVILWLCILFASTSTLFVSCCLIVKHYRLLTSTFRSMDFVCTLAFLIDNFTNSHNHVLSAVIGVKLLCQVFFVTDMHIYIPIIQTKHIQQVHTILKEEKDSEDDDTSKTFYIPYLDDVDVDPNAMTIDELRCFVATFIKKAEQKKSIGDIDDHSHLDLSASSSSMDIGSSETKSKTK